MSRRPFTIYTSESLKARTIEVGECWEWQGYSANKGRVPQVCHDGKMMPVRRLFRDLLGIKTPVNGYLVPKCENNTCVNPDHSKHYTENQFSVYRAKKAAKSHSGNLMRSVKIQAHKRATSAKLTQEKADEIRLSNKTSRELGQIYGVDKTVICRIRAGKSWVNLSANNNPFAGLMR